MLLCDALVFVVPAAALEVESTDQCSVLWWDDLQTALSSHWSVKDFSLVVSRVLLVHKDELELESINLNQELASIVLQNGSQEALREEEAREPEYIGRFLLMHPSFKSCDPHVEVSDVARKRLQVGIGDLKPAICDETLDQLKSSLAQDISHQDLTFLCCLQVIKSLQDLAEKSIESD